MLTFRECAILAALVVSVTGMTEQLTTSNLKQVLDNSELVLINFYADWCHFSQSLKPIFENAAAEIRKKFPAEKVTLAKVDCDRETDIASQYSVNKYPTIKLFRFGAPTKHEYRGQRSVDGITRFVEDQLKDSLMIVADTHVLDNADEQKRQIVGYFISNSSPEFVVFHKVASLLRDYCKFSAVLGQNVQENRIEYRQPKQGTQLEVASGITLTDEPSVLQFATMRCLPLVREITFQNAEELTEEGLPFLILFHHPDDRGTVETFHAEAERQLSQHKNSINILTADGTTFTHPLHHLGKTVKDLPLLAIDSFRHMYIWPYDPKSKLRTGNLLQQFVLDLHSGKLHREFHNGPDPQQANQPSDAPPSVFRLLGPSHNRYTVLQGRDEL
jgi:endoplasmic reticulum resident protein 44